jgi:hypothetical protein
MHVSGGSETSCVAMPLTTTAAVPTTTDPYLANPTLWHNAAITTCGTSIGVTPTSQVASNALTFYTLTVDDTTPQPITFSVCGSAALQQVGLNLYILSENSSHSEVLTFYTAANVSAARGCLIPTAAGMRDPGINMTITSVVPYGVYYMPVPVSAMDGGAGYVYGVACNPSPLSGVTAAPVGPASSKSGLSAGDKSAVIVAVVSVIVIIAVVSAAVIFIKKYQAKTAYDAAVLVRELGPSNAGADGDDEALLSLNQETYEDSFDQSSPETYGEN